MRLFKLKSFVVFFFVMAASLLPTHAQTISLGDDGLIYQVLRQNGYHDARIVKRKLTIVRAEACKGNTRFLVKISILGKITSTSKIGNCGSQQTGRKPHDTRKQIVKTLRIEGYREIETYQAQGLWGATACLQLRRFRLEYNTSARLLRREDIGSCRRQGLTSDDITNRLKAAGYRRVVITDAELPRYKAEGCFEGDRYAIVMNQRGIVQSERRIGSCEKQFNPRNMIVHLEKRGYNRIKVIERRRPPYLAEACKGDSRVKVAVGRFGRIRDEQRIDSCRKAITANQVVGYLTNQGYDRVRVLRGNRLPYIAEACKGTGLVELAIGRYGKIRKEEPVGRCSAPLTQELMQEKLIDLGYSNFRIQRRGGGWRAEGCKQELRVNVRLDAYGDVIRENTIGKCKSQTVLEVLQTLEQRGAKAVNAFVEGCYRGTKYRWYFNRLGERIDRQRIGSC